MRVGRSSRERAAESVARSPGPWPAPAPRARQLPLADDEAAKSVQLIEDDGGAATALRFDVADRDACREALEAEIAKNGSLYGVVCNAGVHADGPFPGMREEAWDRVIETNLGAFYNVLRPLVMPMVRAPAGRADRHRRPRRPA